MNKGQLTLRLIKSKQTKACVDAARVYIYRSGILFDIHALIGCK